MMLDAADLNIHNVGPFTPAAMIVAEDPRRYKAFLRLFRGYYTGIINNPSDFKPETLLWIAGSGDGIHLSADDSAMIHAALMDSVVIVDRGRLREDITLL